MLELPLAMIQGSAASWQKWAQSLQDGDSRECGTGTFYHLSSKEGEICYTKSPVHSWAPWWIWIHRGEKWMAPPNRVKKEKNCRVWWGSPGQRWKCLREEVAWSWGKAPRSWGSVGGTAGNRDTWNSIWNSSLFDKQFFTPQPHLKISV